MARVEFWDLPAMRIATITHFKAPSCWSQPGQFGWNDHLFGHLASRAHRRGAPQREA
jgi:hypothetical protein